VKGARRAQRETFPSASDGIGALRYKNSFYRRTYARSLLVADRHRSRLWHPNPAKSKGRKQPCSPQRRRLSWQPRHPASTPKTDPFTHQNPHHHQHNPRPQTGPRQHPACARKAPRRLPRRPGRRRRSCGRGRGGFLGIFRGDGEVSLLLVVGDASGMMGLVGGWWCLCWICGC